VDFMRVSGEVTDQSLLALKQLEPQLSWLNLANTRVTDAGLVHLKGLKHLTRLHLEKTEISDAGLAHLAGLADLEYLNLYGTNVTDESLATIAGFPSLKAVYLWETKVTDQAAEAFRKSNPKLSVDTGWRLPSDMPLPEKPKTLQISKALKAPDLDGTTDEELWKTAAAIEEFLLLGDGKNKPKAKTTGKLSYDEKFFYVAAICEESGRNEPFITGGPVYQDDAIEIWIDANGDGQTFHQLIVNATGKSQGFGPAGMIDLPAQCFAHAEAGKQWTLEVAIPYTSLGIAAPKTGEKWRFNLCRNRPKGDNFDRELITWNPLQTRFKELDLFGTIIFSAADAAKPANSLCPLTGKPVNTAHTFIHKGTTVGLCCPDCLAKFKEEPDKFFDKVKP
ncbi:MAG: hypothetical protein O2857_26620, partial [Planctomycetota bacterium]|nr:hypothetical protein [Planctomycetota bacterium]